MWKLALLIVGVVVADFQGDVVLRIVPNSDSHVNFLKNFVKDKLLNEKLIEFDIWRDVSHPGENVDIHFNAADVEEVKEMLTANSIKFSYMIDDLQYVLDQEQVENQISGYASGYNYNRYNTYDAIKNELYNIARKYSNVASLFNVGKSYEGQDMIGVKVSVGNFEQSKPAIWIDGGIHAREWISPATAMYFLNYLLVSKDRSVQAALQKYDFYLLPVFNVDGYRYTHRGGRARLWRKTRKPYGSRWRTCYGADPNRNWGYKWGGEGTSRNPCDDIYHGPSAFSEVEVKNVATYLQNLPNLKSYWNIHAYSQLLLTPWSYTRNKPRDYNEMIRVANVFVNKIRERYGTSYRAGPPSMYLYNAAGGSMDWTYGKLGVIYSYAPELRDKGNYGFLLPANQIAPTGLETSEAIIAAVNAMR